MAWVGQQPGEGGIVDQFLDDTVNADRKAAKKKKMGSSGEMQKRRVILKRMEADIKSLKSMRP